MEIKKLANEINRMVEIDQKRRKEIKDWSALSNEEYKKIEDMDHKHTKRLKEIIREHGLITISKFGADTSYNAWLLVQHAGEEELDFMKKYLSLIEKDRDDIDKRNYAYLVDRIRIFEKKPQLYGTQYKMNEETGKWECYEIEDNSNVDKRRAEVGLESLQSYLDDVNE